MEKLMYTTPADISRALLDANTGVTVGIVLTMRVEGSAETFHVLIQSEDYLRFEALAARVGGAALAASTLPGQRVGIQGNYCPAVPGQLITPHVFDLETGAGAGYPGGPRTDVVYMAVSQTEAVAVPAEVDPWIRAYAVGQQALAAR